MRIECSEAVCPVSAGTDKFLTNQIFSKTPLCNTLNHPCSNMFVLHASRVMPTMAAHQSFQMRTESSRRAKLCVHFTSFTLQDEPVSRLVRPNWRLFISRPKEPLQQRATRRPCSNHKTLNNGCELGGCSGSEQTCKRFRPIRPSEIRWRVDLLRVCDTPLETMPIRPTHQGASPPGTRFELTAKPWMEMIGKD